MRLFALLLLWCKFKSSVFLFFISGLKFQHCKQKQQNEPHRFRQVNSVKLLGRTRLGLKTCRAGPRPKTRPVLGFNVFGQN